MHVRLSKPTEERDITRLHHGNSPSRLSPSRKVSCGGFQVKAESHSASSGSSSIDMYNNDVGKRFVKLKGTLTSATLYFTS